VHFEFSKEFQIDFSSADHIQFHHGDRLLIFLSHRFEINELRDLFDQARLNIGGIIFDDDQNYGIVMSKS